jgi:hypothetical protein
MRVEREEGVFQEQQRNPMHEQETKKPTKEQIRILFVYVFNKQNEEKKK